VSTSPGRGTRSRTALRIELFEPHSHGGHRTRIAARASVASGLQCSGCHVVPFVAGPACVHRKHRADGDVRPDGSERLSAAYRGAVCGRTGTMPTHYAYVNGLVPADQVAIRRSTSASRDTVRPVSHGYGLPFLQTSTLRDCANRRSARLRCQRATRRSRLAIDEPARERAY
jgi:hypothetical protein